mmetsp:Transcript_18313/g.51857  ORF Transcript_18313/g.51857 Transcript_18313/m.51857 type:complete len:509 (-) Transcript_18313:135-1661(-)
MKKVRTSGAGLAGKAQAFDAFAADDLGLSFYTNPPAVEVTVREFEEYTRDRLKLLHVFDRLCAFDMRLENMGELKGKVQKELIDSRLSLAYPNASNAEHFPSLKADFIRRDAISHYAMRLAFCKTREAREWFVKNEQRLFVLRFEALSPEAREAYLTASGIKYKKFEAQEGGMNLRDLQLRTPSAKIWRPNATAPELDSTFFEMPFYELTANLIASRRVIVQNGMAYVPSNAMKMIIAKNFKDSLVSSLDVAFQGLPAALADLRVGGFLRELQEHGMQLLVAPKSSTDELSEELSLDNFEEMLARSFPPCMRRVVEKQREQKKHLKHLGRLQLRPFLKDCGFSLDQSVRWWKQELCKVPEIDPSSFEKNYMYDLEHAYGKKGHLQGQNCFGCPKIISFPGAATGQVHGCPFKELEVPALKQQLHKWYVPEGHIKEIENLITHGKHFQLGCIEYFKAKHPGHTGDGVGNTPGDFYRESCKHHVKKLEGAANNSPSKASGGSPSKITDAA